MAPNCLSKNEAPSVLAPWLRYHWSFLLWFPYPDFLSIKHLFITEAATSLMTSASSCWDKLVTPLVNSLAKAITVSETTALGHELFED